MADDASGPWNDYADPPAAPPGASAPNDDPDGPWHAYADPAPTLASTPGAAPPASGSVVGDAAKGAGRGLLEAMTIDAASAPHDLAVAAGHGMDWLARKSGLAGAVRHATGQPDVDPNADQETSFDKLGQTVRANTFDKVVPAAPDSAAGRYSESIARAVPAAVAMPGSAAKNIALQAVLPGAASEAAGERFKGTDYEGAARLTGGLLGGAAGAGAASVGRAAVKASVPFRAAGREAAVGDRLVKAAADPNAVMSALDAMEQSKAADGTTAIGRILPDAQPTLAALAQDKGLAAREQVLRTHDNLPFAERAAQHNDAEVGALPTSDGAAENLSSGLRSVFADLDARESGRLADARNAAQDAATGLGGQQSADFYGRQAQAAVQPDIDAARQGVSSIMDRLGGTDTPEVAGAQGRSVAQAGMDAAKAQRRALYNAIDPDGTLHMVASPAREGANTLANSISPLAAQPSGEEGAILAQMRALDDVVPFGDMQALDSRITAARTAEYRANGESPAYARLGQLKGHVLDAISNGVDNQSAYEQQAVAAGAMSPDATMEARVAQWRDDHLARQREAGLEGYQGRVASGAGGGTRIGPGPSRATSQTGEGLGGAGSNSGVPSAPVQPSFDEAVADRLAAAKAAHATYASTFKQGPVANLLRTNGFAGQYKLVDGGVPNTVFKPGPTGGDAMRAYLAATGDAGAPVARNYAAMSLRRAAMPDGQTLNPARYRTWLGQHDAALRALPDNGRAEFDALGPAQAALDRFAPFTGATAPSAIPEMFFHSGPAGADAINNLRGHIGDRAATSILTDYAASQLRQRALTADGTLDPRRVASFVAAHEPALSALPGLKERFQSAAQASETINNVAAQRKTALDTFQSGVVAKVMGLDDPGDIAKTVGSIYGRQDAAKVMGDLAAKARAAGPDAFEGLRKANIDHIRNSTISNQTAMGEANKVAANKMQTLASTKTHVLSKVFTPDEIANIQRIDANIARNNSVANAALVPRQSGTAQLLPKVQAHGGHGNGSLLQEAFFANEAAEGIGHAAGHLAGHLVGHLVHGGALAGILGKKAINALSASGIRKMDDLEREAYLHPEVGLALMRKAPTPVAKATAGERLARAITKLSPYYGNVQNAGNGSQASSPDAPVRAAGGRVEPTAAQKRAGNYAKDHARFAGLGITIEYLKGSIRSGTSADGKSWSVKMPADYGYVRGSVGADGDHVDCYVGSDGNAPYAWIINQMRLHPRRFDEHKVMLGFRSRAAAVETYVSSFNDGKGKQRIGSVRAVPIKLFPAWVMSEATKKAA